MQYARWKCFRGTRESQASRFVRKSFFAAGKVQARVLGHSELEPLTVPHPIQSLTPDQIRERAEGAVEEIVARLTKNGES